MSVIKAVFLDLGGVLWGPSADRMIAALARFGVHADAATLDRALHEAQVALDVGGDPSDADAYFHAYLRAAGVEEELLSESLDAIETAYEARPWGPRAQDVPESLASLARTGVALAIVSNANGSAESSLREQGVCQVGPGRGTCVAIVVDSGVVGVAKPDPEIFRIALEATGAEPHETVHVGDSIITDMRGAYAAGITPLHFDPYGLCGLTDHAHVASLGEVADLVTRRAH